MNQSDNGQTTSHTGWQPKRPEGRIVREGKVSPTKGPSGEVPGLMPSVQELLVENARLTLRIARLEGTLRTIKEML